MGEPLRFIILKVFLKKLGNSSYRIRDGVTIHFPQRVSIGNNTTLNEWVYIDGRPGVTIGNWVRIGHRVSIIPADHGFKDKKTKIAKQDFVQAPVIIEDDVLIGVDSKILKGVRIGKGAIVGAGSVVIRDVKPYTVVQGVPAKVVRKR